MDAFNAFLVVLTGIFIRLALPIAGTVLLVALLRRMDAQWQLEAEQLAAVPVEKINCWEVKGCSPEDRENCPAFHSQKPCWQERRMENGYLQDQCLGCEVFEQAPIPVHP
jgi:hypothetical protein